MNPQEIYDTIAAQILKKERVDNILELIPQEDREKNKELLYLLDDLHSAPIWQWEGYLFRIGKYFGLKAPKLNISQKAKVKEPAGEYTDNKNVYLICKGEDITQAYFGAGYSPENLLSYNFKTTYREAKEAAENLGWHIEEKIGFID